MRLNPDEDIEDIEGYASTTPKLATWHSMHKGNRHWIEKTIGWVLLAFGSVASIIFHSLWFWGWFQLKLDVSLLTNIVSLEAIFIGVLMLIDGRNKDKQAEAQAAHFQETMDRLEGKLDSILTMPEERYAMNTAELLPYQHPGFLGDHGGG